MTTPNYAFPPDTRQTGQGNPAGDFDNLDDLVGLLYSVLAQLAGGGSHADPGGNTANLATVLAARTAASLAPSSAGTILTSNGTTSAPTFQAPATVPADVLATRILCA